MKIDRRRALALMGLGAVPVSARAADVTYGHGVASGDPWSESVVLWTRLTTPAANLSGEAEVALDLGFRQVVKRYPVQTGAHRDHTVKLVADGLKPGTEYWYRFVFEGVASPVGRTRTTARSGSAPVVLAVASCTLYPNGYFTAYQAIADLPKVDAVIHLGDYIYEYGGPGSYGMNSPVAAERAHAPDREIFSLSDYRTRHAQYKADPMSQAAHARAPWIVVWDDHETANDSFADGAQNHEAQEGDWATRKAIAIKAYYEWMPIREPAGGGAAINRSFHFGDVASLHMLETRLTARDQQLNYERDLPEVDGKRDLEAFRAKLNDPTRKMMGPGQVEWLGRELAASVKAGRTWQVIGNEVLMAKIKVPDLQAALGARYAELLAAEPEAGKGRARRYAAQAAFGAVYGLDMWDGYPAERERVFATFRATGARPIVLAGDSHCFWANELYDSSGAHVAVEFGATGITSPGGGDYFTAIPVGAAFENANPEVVFNDQKAKGFVLLTLTKTEAKAEMVAVSTILQKDFTASPVKTLTVRPLTRGVSKLAVA